MKKEFKLGVLLVHGIGTQPALDSLTRWTDTLVAVINKAAPESLSARVRRAHAAELGGGCGSTAELDLHWDSEHEHERWLVAEGWWADAFPAPTYAELVSWGLHSLPWLIAGYTHRTRLPARKLDEDTLRGAVVYRFPRDLGRIHTLAVRITMLFVLPIIVSALAALLLLGALPLPKLRSIVSSAQSRLTGTIGDCLAYNESPVRAALIRSRVCDALWALNQRCERTIVIAHSQGAAICVDALGGMASSNTGTAHPDCVAPHTLLTFGAGTNPLAALRGPFKRLFSWLVWIEVAAMYGAIGLLVLTVYLVQASQMPWLDVLTDAGIVFAAALGGAFITAVLFYVVRLFLSESKRSHFQSPLAIVGTLAVVLLGGAATAVYCVRRFDLPPMPLALIGSAALGLLVSLPDSLSWLAERGRARVQHPPGVKSWVDLYASSDPVPHGPTRRDVREIGDRVEATLSDAAESEDGFNATEIHNNGSVLTDHTTYWLNHDGFVLRAIRACSRAASSPWLTELPIPTEASDHRALWRIRHFRAARLVLWLGSTAVLVQVWLRHVTSRQSIPEGTIWGDPQHLAVFMAAVFVTAYVLLRVFWRRWVREEQDHLLAGSPPVGTPWRPFIRMGSVLGLGVLLLAAPLWTHLILFHWPSIDLFALVLVFIVGGVTVELLARMLLPAPTTLDGCRS